MYRIISIFLVLLFLFCALVQLNDPDPIFWFVTYILVSLVHWEAVHKRYYRRLSLLAALLSFAGFLWFWPDQYRGVAGVMKTDVPQIEEARESLGLLLISLSLFFVAARAYWVWPREQKDKG